MTALDGDIQLTPLNGETRPLSDWLTTFPLLIATIDPYAHESSWLLDTIHRILTHYAEADVRVVWLATANAEGTAGFLGPYADDFLTFSDSDHTVARALGLTTLPGLSLVKQDQTIAASAQGWDPDQWRDVVEAVSDLTEWSSLTVPGPRDPAAYAGRAL